MLRDSAAAKICKKRVSFEVDAPQSSYKALFQGTSLRTALSRISSEKIAPTGLKHQECERRRGGEKAPIRYVPERDPVQEVLELKPESLNCTLANGSETRVTVWSGHGTNKQFLLHVNKAASVAKNMGLYSAFDDAKAAHDLKKMITRQFFLNSLKSTKLTPQMSLKQRKRPPSHSCSRQRLATSRKK